MRRLHARLIKPGRRSPSQTRKPILQPRPLSLGSPWNPRKRINRFSSPSFPLSSPSRKAQSPPLHPLPHHPHREKPAPELIPHAHAVPIALPKTKIKPKPNNIRVLKRSIVSKKRSVRVLCMPGGDHAATKLIWKQSRSTLNSTAPTQAFMSGNPRPVKLIRKQPRSNLDSTAPTQALISGKPNDLLKQTPIMPDPISGHRSPCFNFLVSMFIPQCVVGLSIFLFPIFFL
jgi:hypothetical protein